MAKQYKKLKQKIHPKKKESSAPKEKPGKDYILLVMIFFTLVIMLIGWAQFSDMNRALYVFLTLSLTLTYARRHARMTDTQRIFVERAGWASIGIATAIFIILCYYQYIA